MSPEPNIVANQIARLIEAGGPISVAEFMRMANDAYYSRQDPFGVDGDFITAPEVSQMFGELVGLWLADIWIRAGRPTGCKYVEYGPGRGTLAADALRSMQAFGFKPDCYFIENSEALRRLQRANVPAAQFIDSVDDVPTDGLAFVVANEFFDALPVRQLVSTHSGWRERVVVRDRGNSFIASPGLKPMDAVIPAELRNAPSPCIYEFCPDAGVIMAQIANKIASQGGAALVIDYGYLLPGLGDTLQSVRKHKFAQPFENPGEQDLTAHVNFLELANVARMKDLRVQGPVEQGKWLTSLGIETRTRMLCESAPHRKDELLAASSRLIDATEMGSLFKVLAVSSPSLPDPEGFDG